MWVLYTMGLVVAVVALVVAYKLLFSGEDMPDIEDVAPGRRDPRQGRFG